MPSEFRKYSNVTIGNRKRGEELTPKWRAAIATRVIGGATESAVARKFNCSRGAVRRAVVR